MDFGDHCQVLKLHEASCPVTVHVLFVQHGCAGCSAEHVVYKTPKYMTGMMYSQHQALKAAQLRNLHDKPSVMF